MKNSSGLPLHRRVQTDRLLIKRLRSRALLIRAIRHFFEERGFIEVTTPSLALAPDPALHLDSFQTQVHLQDGNDVCLYLPTSPEGYMKRMLAAGMERIYQICPFFRNGDLGPLHNPEFTGLEWYQAACKFEQTMDFTESLIKEAARSLDVDSPGQTLAPALDLSKPFQRITVFDALTNLARVKVPSDWDEKGLKAALHQAGIATDPSDGFDDLVHRALLDRVEPRLATMGPVFLYEYPAPMAALARLCPGRPWVAERFELYLGGMELCNGYGELTDAAEQRARFEIQRQDRTRLGKPVGPVDEAFLEALEHGMPEASGCALGVDRLLMCLCGCKRIEEVMAFPLSCELDLIAPEHGTGRVDPS
jgi:elongation factor P--(R)-beta-lysine ligase